VRDHEVGPDTASPSRAPEAPAPEPPAPSRVAFLQAAIGNRATTQLLNRMPAVAEIEAAAGKKGGKRFDELTRALDFYQRLLDNWMGPGYADVEKQGQKLQDLLGRIEYLSGEYAKDHTWFGSLRDKRTKRLSQLQNEARIERQVVRQRTRLWKTKISEQMLPPKWRAVIPDDLSAGVMDLDKLGATAGGKSKGGINEVTKYSLAGGTEGFFKPDKKEIQQYEWVDEEEKPTTKNAPHARRFETTEYNVTAPYGIDPKNPNYTRKATATSRLDRLLGPGVAAHTSMAVKKIGGKSVFGSFQKTASGEEFGKIQDKLVLDDTTAPDEFSTADPTFQRQMSNLNILDALTGQIDRHGGNFYVNRNGAGGVRSITAIDHDLSFPTKKFDVRQKAREYYGLPQHVDRQTAEMVMAIEGQELRGLLQDLLNEEEIKCTIERLEAIKLALAGMTWVSAGGWTKSTAQKEVTSTNSLDPLGYIGNRRQGLGQKPITG
jgi:hypothetical protein